MTIHLITLFPQMILTALEQGVVGQAIKAGLVQIKVVNPRDFTSDVHKTVDDRPFGGGDGMVMMIDPLARALESLGEGRGRVVNMSPQGQLWRDDLARKWAASNTNLTLICGRYAGIDERFTAKYVDQEISIGDYVLSGGEIAALAVIDSLARFIPGVLGNPDSPYAESFANGLLECPQFTRPAAHALGTVPDVLLSGHHERIVEFRLAVSIVRTHKLRPDLLAKSDMKNRLQWAKNLLAKSDPMDLAMVGLTTSDVRVSPEGYL